jgi:hypothetical protein
MPDKGPLLGDIRWIRRESHTQAPMMSAHGKRLIKSCSANGCSSFLTWMSTFFSRKRGKSPGSGCAGNVVRNSLIGLLSTTV